MFIYPWKHQTKGMALLLEVVQECLPDLEGRPLFSVGSHAEVLWETVDSCIESCQAQQEAVSRILVKVLRVAVTHEPSRGAHATQPPQPHPDLHPTLVPDVLSNLASNSLSNQYKLFARLSEGGAVTVGMVWDVEGGNGGRRRWSQYRSRPKAPGGRRAHRRTTTNETIPST
jgi:hypothetical protein